MLRLQFVFLLGEALLVRNSNILESWFNLQLLHTCLVLLAFFVGVGGVAIKTLQKRERKREDPNATVKHFRSNHGFPGEWTPHHLSVYTLINCVLSLCYYFIFINHMRCVFSEENYLIML